jgi:cystathionine beta-lyase/cystathionine gamma-synthase
MSIDSADVAICLSDDPLPSLKASPMATPIVQTSLFAFANFQALLDALADEHRNYVYTRGQNPTVDELERKLAALEQGESCKCFASGMAAISGVMLGLLRSGDHVLFVNQTYGPALQLARHLSRFGIEHTQLLDLDADSVRRAMQRNTRLVWLESPGTMLFRTMDIGAVAAVAHEHPALVCLDNSWATPLFQKPIRHGIDIVVHSATKYLGGHSDLVAGAVIANAELMEQIFRGAFLLNGGILAPFDAWLLLRGIRTLPVRMRQHAADALTVARYLATVDKVSRVNHPVFGDPSDSLTGWSGLFSFEVASGGFENVRDFIDGLRLFRIGVSWGGVESLVLSPNHGNNLARLDAQRIPHGLVRLSIGLEGADALIEDLAAALDNIQAPPGSIAADRG